MQCRGEGGVAPFKKNDVILRARPQTAWRPKDLVLTELFLGQRGAITRKSAVNCRKSLIKHFVCTFYSQHKQNHCVILKLHSDFPFSYTFSFFGAVQNTSPAPRRAKNNLRVTMIQCLPSANCRSVFSAYASIFLRKTDRPTGRRRPAGAASG